MKLFLDDVRDPEVCVTYMYQRIGKENPIYLEEWKIVRNYEDFVASVKREFPTHISFDHDLGEDITQYQIKNGIYSKRQARKHKKEVKSGMDCAKWLIEYVRKNKLKLPVIYVHSQNPIGTENLKKDIIQLYKNGKTTEDIQKIVNLNLVTIKKVLRGIPKRKRTKKIKVHQYTLDNILIQEWDDAKTASEKLNIVKSCITNACNGNLKTYKGFIWKY